MRILILCFGTIFCLFAPVDRASACTAPTGYSYTLAQDWPKADRTTWYKTSQGSRLLPMAWYDALVLKGGDTRFASRSNQQRYASLFCDDSDLPLGFVIDQAEGKPDALGLTCAACHTGVLDYNGQAFIVEGGSSELDLQTYLTDIFAALDGLFTEASSGEGTAWPAFAAEILGEPYSRAQEDALFEDLATWLEKRYQVQQSIEAGGVWGHGRTDAVQVILNTASVISGTRAGATLPASTAPVSIPHVWNAHQMERVQWNGSARKVKDIGVLKTIEFGSVIRDVAELIGVFGEIELTTSTPNNTATYPSLKSSTKLANIVRLERALETLKSPAWPAEWGAVDVNGTDYARGKALYDENCAQCHSVLDRENLTVRIADAAYQEQAVEPVTRHLPAFSMPGTKATPVGTDPMMACNAQTHTSWAGTFQALHNSFGALRKLNADMAGGGTTVVSALRNVKLDKFPEGVATLRLIEELSLRMIYEKNAELTALQAEDAKEHARGLYDAILGGLFGTDPGRKVDPASIPDVPEQGTHGLKTVKDVEARCAEFLLAQKEKGQGEFLPEYKARPLNGIFASAPYLHNGSVPTLDDLLKPVDQRNTSFATGAVYFDPVKVGLGAPKPVGASTPFQMHDAEGRIIPGNSNQGHAYPDVPFSDTDRAALIAYLKTL